MGSYCSSEKVQPQEVNNIHPMEERSNVNDDSNDRQKDGNNKHRRVTDVLFLLISIALLTCLGVLITYCILYGNIYRVLNGYNNCGDVCGIQNLMDGSTLLCKGEDLQKEPYLMIQYAYTHDTDINYLERSCVANCESYPGFRQLLNRCVPKDDKFGVNTFISRLGIRNFFLEAREDLDTCWKEIIYMFIIAFILSLIIVILLRYFVGFVVWIVLIGVTLSCIIAMIVGWVLFVNYKDDLAKRPSNGLQSVDNTKYYSYLAFAFIATIVSICVILIIIVMRKRIQLVVQLFKEAGKGISAMPLIIFQPILTFIAITIAICSFLYFSLWIESAGFLTPIADSLHNYVKDNLMIFTRWYNILIFLWMIQFIIGCQHMVIAGAIATWYFMRDKSTLGYPILYSTYNLIRYHLGSVAFGSFLIALVQFIRLILALIQRYFKNKEGKCVDYVLKCCHCCLYIFETILKYITKNAYIEIALYGHSFCLAGKQAFNLLVDNAFRVTVINSVGDFVLFLAKVFVVAATVLIGMELIKDKEGVLHMWVPLTVAGICAYFVSNCFLTVYEMAIDTIFLCFCEDCQQNDGINRPYFMSKGLMEYVDNSKKVLAYVNEFDREVTKQAWQGPSTISSKVTI